MKLAAALLVLAFLFVMLLVLMYWESDRFEPDEDAPDVLPELIDEEKGGDVYASETTGVNPWASRLGTIELASARAQRHGYD